MRNRFQFMLPVREVLGALFWVFGLILLVPLGLWAFERDVSPITYIVPAIISMALGFVLKRRTDRQLDARGATLLCALGWIGVSAVGALPFVSGLGMSYLDAYFETVSGFTTTGITLLSGLDDMPRSILLWRSLIQWLGGLGILSFFMIVIRVGGSAHRLYRAESHKIASKQPAPNLGHSLQILWGIYAAYTLLIVLMLVAEDVTVFDAVTHAFTTLSTGGYSPYDASIGHYAATGHPNAIWIEYTFIFGMLLGGMNFFVHHRVWQGDLRALWDNVEVRLWWALLAVMTGLVALDHWMQRGFGQVEYTVRTSLFQVMSIATTTGYATQDINSAWFPSLAKQIFLVLMVIGGCVGSTGGGVKVLRIAVLWKMLKRQVHRAMAGRDVVNMVLVDRETIDSEEIRRIAALFFGWVALLVIGGGVTAVFAPHLGPLEAVSGMFSALGNIGPCYITVPEMIAIHPVVKTTYIIGMLAGRLEIIPILLIFSRRAWR